MKIKLSPIQQRLLRHFTENKPLSIKNMWMLRITNPSREVTRNFEIPFGVAINRKIVTWKENGEHGYYTEYSINPNDIPTLRNICKDNRIMI